MALVAGEHVPWLSVPPASVHILRDENRVLDGVVVVLGRSIELHPVLTITAMPPTVAAKRTRLGYRLFSYVLLPFGCEACTVAAADLEIGREKSAAARC